MAGGPNLSDEEVVRKWEDGYFELLDLTSKYIKVNRVKLLSFTGEDIYGDEALVRVQTGNAFSAQEMAFYLHRTDKGWKIFLIDSDTSSEPVINIYAQERPPCAQ